MKLNKRDSQIQKKAQTNALKHQFIYLIVSIFLTFVHVVSCYYFGDYFLNILCPLLFCFFIFTVLCLFIFWFINFLLFLLSSSLFHGCHIMLCLIRPAHFRLRASQRKTYWHLQLPRQIDKWNEERVWSDGQLNGQRTSCPNWSLFPC